MLVAFAGDQLRHRGRRPVRQRRDRAGFRAVIEKCRVIAPDELRQVGGGEYEVGTEETHGIVDTPERSLWRTTPPFPPDRVHCTDELRIGLSRLPSRGHTGDPLANGTEQALPGGVEPQFLVDVAAAGSTYWSGGRRSSSAELAAALRAAAASSSSRTAIVVAVAIVACLVLVTLPLLLIAVVPAGIGLFAWSTARDARRRRVAVRYRLDERAAKAFESLSNGAGWLQNSRAVWRITRASRFPGPAPAAPCSCRMWPRRTTSPAGSRRWGGGASRSRPRRRFRSRR